MKELVQAGQALWQLSWQPELGWLQQEVGQRELRWPWQKALGWEQLAWELEGVSGWPQEEAASSVLVYVEYC